MFSWQIAYNPITLLSSSNPIQLSWLHPDFPELHKNAPSPGTYPGYQCGCISFLPAPQRNKQNRYVFNGQRSTSFSFWRNLSHRFEFRLCFEGSSNPTRHGPWPWDDELYAQYHITSEGKVSCGHMATRLKFPSFVCLPLTLVYDRNLSNVGPPLSYGFGCDFGSCFSRRVSLRHTWSNRCDGNSCERRNWGSTSAATSELGAIENSLNQDWTWLKIIILRHVLLSLDMLFFAI